MPSPEQDNIVYDIGEEESPVPSRPETATRLLLVTLVFGAVVWVAGHLDSNSAIDGRTALVGFDASSPTIKVCEGVGKRLPDFSIVVAGEDPSLPDLRQFAIVEVTVDPRYGRALPTEVMCTLPE